MTIAEFLAARLDEDEAAAKDVYGFWRAHGERSIADDSYAAVLIADVDPETRAHILRHAPPRVLREVEAGRKILAEHAIDASIIRTYPFDPFTGKPNMPGAEVNCAVCGWASIDPTSGCRTLRLLAAVYSDHPDYDPAWSA